MAGILQGTPITNYMQDDSDFPEDSEFDPENPFPDPIEIEITDVFDLHTIPPRDVKAVVEEYLSEARRLGFPVVRIIHGKGIGQLRNTVHALLRKHSAVAHFALASEHYGGAGATIARLKTADVR